ncbi:MAG: ABC transporter permease [Chloracidobacterium sp.]|nr:ABC transporter permease [Chloracidobacterium sp.]
MTGGRSLITIRQWQRHKLRLVLTILGIALGVAVFFAVRITNSALIDSLQSTINKLAGRSTIQIVAGETGFSEDVLRVVRGTEGVELAEPVCEIFATLDGPAAEKIMILGLDTTSDLTLYQGTFDQESLSISNPLAFSSRGDSIAITHSLAERLGVGEGGRIRVNIQSGPMEFTVRGLFRSTGAGDIFDGNVAVMDIAAAQDAFGRTGRIDRIDVAGTAGVETEELQRRLTEHLPSGIRAVRPDLRGQGLENSVSSMHYGLTIMSFFALSIGLFIIYNSFSISVNQRWKEIAILRGLGLERRKVRRMFLLEAAAMGLIGSVTGIAVGFLLAQLALRFVGRVMATFYGFAISSAPLDFNFGFAVEAVLAGTVASVAAAWIPARYASNLDPALALHNVETRDQESGIGFPRFIAGIALVVSGLLLVRFADPTIDLNFQLFYTLILQLGMILLVPVITYFGAKAIRPVMSAVFGIEGTIAVETMARAPRRTGSTVIALMLGLAFVFGTTTLIESQKGAVDRSIKKALSADIVINSAEEVNSKTYRFNAETVGKITALPEVERADPLRIFSFPFDGQEIVVLSHDMDAYFDIAPDILDVGDAAAARDITARGEGMLVSNNFAARWNVNLGDVVTLETPTGPLSLPVVGLLDYYRSQTGTIFFDRSLLAKYWQDTDADYVLLDLKAGVDHSLVRSKIENVLSGEQRAFVYTHEEYRRWVGDVVDQFFGLMYVQMAIAFFVAVLGLVNTMVISVAERRREIGILRAIGGKRRQLLKMILLEGVAIALIGLFAGGVGGLMNAYFLVNTASRVVSGFSLPMVLPVKLVVIAVPVMIALAVISAWVPARHASRINVVDAIGYE